jgi:hypothetical protein
MSDENDRYFRRKLSEDKEHKTPKLRKKAAEDKDGFYKRMNTLGYANGDLEKVPHHWNSDDNEVHMGVSEACKICNSIKSKSNEDNKKVGMETISPIKVKVKIQKKDAVLTLHVPLDVGEVLDADSKSLRIQFQKPKAESKAVSTTAEKVETDVKAQSSDTEAKSKGLPDSGNSQS